MKKTKRVAMIIVIGVIAMGLAGCTDGDQFLPEQVITNALEKPIEPFAHYLEAELTTSGLGEDDEQLLLKEWVSKDGKRRTETKLADGSDPNIAVNDGTQMITYRKETNQVFLFNNDEALSELNQMSPKTQAEQLLRTIQHSHDITAAGEEKIAGRDAYHIVAKAKQSSDLLGDQELWIDKEKWLVLKMISTSGDYRSELVITKLEINPDLSPDLFTLDLPDDVEIVDLDELSSENEVTLEEAVQAIGMPFLTFSESSGLTITKVELVELKGELNRNEINIDYEMNGLPAFTLTVFQSPEEDGLDLLPGETEITIREHTGTYMEMNEFRSLVWQEDGLNYSVLFVNPTLSLDEFTALAEQMMPVQS